MQEIKVDVTGHALLNLHDLTPFQGNLKTLTRENYEKCKKSILELNFSEPFSVWMHRDKYYILNGHMRLKTLLWMEEEEGYIMPELPVTIVHCKDEKEAKRKVLAFTSQYGEMMQPDLIDFCQNADLDYYEVLANYRFPEIQFITEEETDADEETVETEDESDDETKTTTIKVKVQHADRDEAIKKITKALSELAGVDIL